MSRFRALALASIAAAAMLLVGTSAVSAGITGSPHDLSQGKYLINTNGISGTSQICIPCHTPHNGERGTQQQILWNHYIPATNYTLYNVNHATDRGDFSNGLDSRSKLCLSCHDGLYGLDAFGGTMAGGAWAPNTGTPSKAMTGDAVIGQDLSNTHPVGVVYSGWNGTTYTGHGIDPNTWKVTANFPTGAPKLIQVGTTTTYVVGCTSCHTPHDYTYKFVRMDNSRSALCLSCHAE